LKYIGYCHPWKVDHVGVFFEPDGMGRPHQKRSKLNPLLCELPHCVLFDGKLSLGLTSEAKENITHLFNHGLLKKVGDSLQ